MRHGPTTLKALVEDELNWRGETEDDIEAILIGEGDENNLGWPERQFVDELGELEQYEGHTGHGGDPFPGVTVWTADRIYFKQSYDGSEWVTSLPRNPTDNERPVW